MDTASSPIAIADPKELFCGLIMPIAEFDNCSADHWEEVRTIIGDAVEAVADPRFRVRMVSEGDETGIIHRRIIQNVYAAPIVICDVSGRNPNVLFELGMRLAFDKPVVIIKDDKTPFMFDTGMIEHLPYPRDLRHGAIENFKDALVKKVINTYTASLEKPDSVSFIKSFGPFKTVSLDEVKEPADKAILTMLGEMQGQIKRLANAVAHDARIPFLSGGGTIVTSGGGGTIVTGGGSGGYFSSEPEPAANKFAISDFPKKVIADFQTRIRKEWAKERRLRPVMAVANREFANLKSMLGSVEFEAFVRQTIAEFIE
jgi:hypothetical protein